MNLATQPLTSPDSWSWKELLSDERQKPYFRQLTQFVDDERTNGKVVYPPAADVFNAFKFTPFPEVRCVILGQDPYHGAGQAHGLCFSVQPAIRPPPSLKNIHKELANDLGCPIPNHGSLESWARSGVFLLNTTLTVLEGQPMSHAGKGWETFTDEVIRRLSLYKSHLVFLLWGAHAQKKRTLIDGSKHCIICSAHPSPFSAHSGFFGSKPFSRTNEFLVQSKLAPIDWSLDQEHAPSKQ